MSEKLWLWLVAGPNGAGKSTFAPQLSAAITQIIGPDAIAEHLLPMAPEKAALPAGREAIRHIRESLKEHRSFAIETTLSGRFHFQIARDAKSQGWNVGLTYIVLSTPELAIARVRKRRRKGGHHVPAADVRRRYERSLRNLPYFFSLADAVFVLDNSSTKHPRKMVLGAPLGKGHVQIAETSDVAARKPEAASPNFEKTPVGM
jgi:predicted ABC-type ATPase